MLGMVSFPTFGLGQITATAGTAFLGLIPGRNDLRAKVASFRYTSGATAHTLTFMRPKAKVTLAASVAKGATTIILASDPGAWGAATHVTADPIAANDYIAYETDTGVWERNLVSAVTVNADGTVTCTVTATGAAITKSDHRYVHLFGAIADVNPKTGVAHYAFKPAISATTNYDGNGSAFVESVAPGDPILIHSGNATAAGYLENVNTIYGV